MKLKLLKLSNCLGIDEKEISIGKVTLIDGESRSGKTSIIDSIRKGLENKNIRPNFVKGDNKEGTVFMKFDEDFDIVRTVKSDNKSELKINKGGMTPTAPQTYLNKMLGDNNFAPIDWLKKKDSEQTEDLLRLLPIRLTPEDVTQITGEDVGIDYDQHGLLVCEDLEKYYVETRRKVNADIRSYKANIKEDEDKLPNEYDPDRYRDVKLNDLFSKISDAEETNNQIKEAKSVISNSDNLIKIHNEQYDSRLNSLIEEFNRRKEQLSTERDGKIKKEKETVAFAQEYLSKNNNIDTTKMREEAVEIEHGQSFLRLYDNLADNKASLKEKAEVSEKYTSIIEDIRGLPAELLEDVETPIEGMGVEDGVVTINGLPIKNLSDGEKLELSIEIARATSGGLKLILVNGFEQLNWDNQKKLFKEMQHDDYQYIITRVTDGELSISHIEDNTIKNTETGEEIML